MKKQQSLGGGAREVIPLKDKKLAFTLAEVLITLAVIGVVAALTLPTLIQKQQEKAIVSQLKEFYSIFQQALMLAREEKGDYYSENNTASFYYYIKPYLKIQKDCVNGTGCFPDVMIKALDGSDWVNINTYTNYQKLILVNGALLQMYNGSDWADRAEIRVDVNGFKKPNTLGRDIFYFTIENNNIIPKGLMEDVRPFETHCSPSSKIEYNGDSCTAWVIFNENIDYLHCDDLSWNGKRKCSQN